MSTAGMDLSNLWAFEDGRLLKLVLSLPHAHFFCPFHSILFCPFILVQLLFRVQNFHPSLLSDETSQHHKTQITLLNRMASPCFHSLLFVSTLLVTCVVRPVESDELDDAKIVDKRSSEEYGEFIKGNGRFPMGFGKRTVEERIPSLVMLRSVDLTRNGGVQGTTLVKYPGIQKRHIWRRVNAADSDAFY